MQIATLAVGLVDLYMLLVLARVVLSWIGQDDAHPVARLLVRLTAPLLEPLRRLVPAVGGLDFSPALALLALMFLRRALSRLLT